MRAIFTTFSHVTAPPALLTNRKGMPLMQTAGQLAHLILHFLSYRDANLDNLKGMGKRIAAGAVLNMTAKIPPWLGKGADNIAAAARVYDQWQELRKASVNVTYAWHGISREGMCSKLSGISAPISQKIATGSLTHAITRFVVELLKFIVHLDDFHRSLQTSEDRSYLIIENGYQVLEVVRKHRVEFNTLMESASLPSLELIEQPIRFLDNPLCASVEMAVAAQGQMEQVMKDLFQQRQ